MEFKEYTVEELVKLNMLEKPMDGNHGGKHPTSKDYVKKGIPFIMVSDINNGKINYKTCKYISKNTRDSLDKGFSKPNDVLLSHKATIGLTAIVGEDYEEIVLTPQLTYYRVINNINNRYLKYYFDSQYFQNILNGWATSGSTRAYLGITAQLKLPILLPNMNTQNKIAKVLSDIDKKIELNNQINDNLYKILNSLYKSWFEDFDNFKYQKFKESEIGKIPNNFDVIELNDLINIRGGLAYKASKLSEDHSDNILVSMGSVELNKMFNFNNLKYYSEDVVDKYVAEVGDLFICTRDVTQQRNQLGCPGLIPKLFENKKTIIGTNLYIVDYKKIGKILNKYMFLLLNSSSYRERIVGSAKGTAVLMIAKDDILEFKFPFPKSEIIIYEFNKIITPLFELIENNVCENNKLEQLRDTLLPKLMNGEIELDKIGI